MKTKKISKEAGVLLIAAFMILSTVVVSADTVNLEVKNSILKTGYKYKSEINPIGPVVWDNGMDYEGLAAAQWDESIPFDAYCADDFHFDEDTVVWDVHWIGGYFLQGEPANAEFTWCISFFKDDGSGESPIGHPYDPSYAGPYCFEWEDIEKEEIEEGYYLLSVILPEGITFNACEKYWISIWGVGAFPPQSGWGRHLEILLHQGKFASDYFGQMFWNDSEIPFGEPYDYCFQLTAEGEPVPDLDCDGALAWTEVKPGDTVTGDFALGNTGDAGSILNWKVKSYPPWGTWTFNPPNGAQPPGWITVNVTVIAPSEKNQNFTGEVVLENTDDPSDVCRITVLLSTPKTKAFHFNLVLINWLLEQFPILKYILGL